MKEQGWLRMEKINTVYKLEQFRLNFSRGTNRDYCSALQGRPM